MRLRDAIHLLAVVAAGAAGAAGAACGPGLSDGSVPAATEGGGEANDARLVVVIDGVRFDVRATARSEDQGRWGFRVVLTAASVDGREYRLDDHVLPLSIWTRRTAASGGGLGSCSGPTSLGLEAPEIIGPGSTELYQTHHGVGPGESLEVGIGLVSLTERSSGKTTAPDVVAVMLRVPTSGAPDLSLRPGTPGAFAERCVR